MPRLEIGQGRVTSRDASLHVNGEVSEAQDCFYPPANPGLRAIKGRTAFNATAESGAVDGGAYLEYDDGTKLIVALVRGGSAYRKATAGTTGTFSDIAGFDSSTYTLAGSATTLDTAYYNTKHILVNGVDRPRVVQADGTQLFLGMLKTTAAGTVSRDAGGGTGFTLTSGSTTLYWIEERVKIDGTVVKRSAPEVAARTTLTGDGTLDKPVYTRATLLNPDTTHWALFGTATDGIFPIGAEIGEVVAATTTIEDTREGADPGLPSGDAFEFVSLSIAGVIRNLAKWGPPPIGNSVEIFEDGVVMNDVSNPSLMHYAFTDNIHAWPDDFKIRFDSKYFDEIKAFKAMDNFMVVLMHDGAWRVNTLPKSTDQAFETERVKSEIDEAFGTVNSKSLAVFSFGEGIRLAYVSASGGIVVTDGSRWSTISDDMDWQEAVADNQDSKIRLLNNPDRFALEMSYAPPGAGRATKMALLHYHPSHAKETDAGDLRAKLTWPVNRDTNDLFLGKVSGRNRVFSANEDGRIYLHDEGFTEPTASGGIEVVVRTSDAYPAGIGLHATVIDAWVHHAAAAGVTATATVVQRNSGEADAPVSVQVPLTFREPTPFGRKAEGEAFQFEVSISNPTKEVTINHFAADFEFAGRTEAK